MKILHKIQKNIFVYLYVIEFLLLLNIFFCNNVQCTFQLVSFVAVLMYLSRPQLTSAEPSETFHPTKLTNDIEASKFKKPAL